MVIASGVMTIFFYKGLTGNQKYPYLSFAQYLETGVSLGSKFGTNVQNVRATAFTVSEVLRENQQGG